MEEELREAVEILCAGLFFHETVSAILQMVHESGLPKPDKLYFLNRIVNHYAGEGEDRTAYHNNAYGLIEYISNPDSFLVDYKNQNGERKRTNVTYEQLYSVMEYLVRAGLFTDKARMEKYEKDFARMPYEKKSALEKQFEDKLQIQNSRKKAENFRFEAAELPKSRAENKVSVECGSHPPDEAD